MKWSVEASENDGVSFAFEFSLEDNMSPIGKLAVTDAASLPSCVHIELIDDNGYFMCTSLLRVKSGSEFDLEPRAFSWGPLPLREETEMDRRLGALKKAVDFLNRTDGVPPGVSWPQYLEGWRQSLIQLGAALGSEAA